MIERLRGHVLAVSETIKLKFGDTIFIELQMQDVPNVFLLLTGVDQHEQNISIGACFILMKTAKKFRWRDSRLADNDSDKTENNSYFMIDALNQFEVSDRTHVKHNANSPMSSQIGTFGDIYPKLFNTLSREVHSRREQNVEGLVRSVLLKFGCVRLSMANNVSDTNDTISLCIYCPHGKLLTNLSNNLTIGSLLKVYNVLPVYLWNELRGFACTVRSSIKLININGSALTKPSSIKLDMKVHRALRMTCVLYSVWRIETHRRLAKALEISDKSSGDFEFIFVVLESLGFVERNYLSNQKESVSYDLFETQILTVTNQNNTNVRKRLALLPQCIQDEFRGVTHAQLHQIRSGLDVDWLGDRLPEVWTCSRLRGAAANSVRRHIDLAGVSQKQMFDTSVENLCLSAEEEEERVRLVVLTGSVRSVEMSRSYRQGLSAHLGLVDGMGCAVSVVVRSISEKFHKFLADRVCGQSFYESIPSRQGYQPRVVFTFEADHLFGFTFLLPRPTCCVVEEHPLHNEQSCGLSVVASEGDVVIIASKGDKEQFAWRGVDVESASKSIVGPGLEDDVWRGSDCLQVRDVLSLDLMGGGAQKSCSVFGLVMSKQVILDDFSRASSHQYPHKARKSDRSSLRQKCKVTLRDVRYPDVIVVYLSLTQATGLMVGMAVQIPVCQLCLPESRKKPYLRTDGGPQLGTVDVVGFCDLATLEELCAQSRSTSGRRDVGSSVSASTPSVATIAFVLSMCGHNRCLWSLVGQIAFVRRMLVTLRCTNCLTLASSSYGAYKCARCDSTASLAPLWETVVAFGDGSGEADLHVEGPNVHLMVRSRFDRGGRDWHKVVRLVEQTVRQTGKVVFDAFSARRGDVVKGDSLEDFLWNEEDEANSAPSTVGTNSADPSSILNGYLNGCSFATHFKVTCSVDFYAQHQQLQQQQGCGLINGGTVRRVNLQELNKDFPYRAVFAAMPTSASPRLCLEAYGVTELHRDKTRLAAWKLLEQIEQQNNT